MSFTYRILLNTVVLALVGLLYIMTVVQVNAQELNVFFKLTTPESDFRNAEISIIKNNSSTQKFSPPKRRVKVKLEFDTEYLLLFELEGCRTKEIFVNTKNVPRHMKHEELEVAFEIELSKAFQFNPEPYLNSSVVRWYYHSDEGEFSYSIDSYPDSSLEANDHTIRSSNSTRSLPYERIIRE